MLKSQEYSNCLELLSEEWIMEYTEPPNNMLHKAKHTSSRKEKKNKTHFLFPQIFRYNFDFNNKC